MNKLHSFFCIFSSKLAFPHFLVNTNWNFSNESHDLFSSIEKFFLILKENKGGKQEKRLHHKKRVCRFLKNSFRQSLLQNGAARFSAHTFLNNYFYLKCYLGYSKNFIKISPKRFWYCHFSRLSWSGQTDFSLQRGKLGRSLKLSTNTPSAKIGKLLEKNV